MTDNIIKYLDRLQKISDSATKGPWIIEWVDDEIWGIEATDDAKGCAQIVKTDTGIYPPERPDAEFIITARNEIDRLIQVNRKLVEALDDMSNMEMNIKLFHHQAQVYMEQARIVLAEVAQMIVDEK